MAMKFKYMRIQGVNRASNTMHPAGIFSMCIKLIQDGVMDEEDAGLYREIDSWFVDKLPFPEPCKNKERVICYFKVENADMMIKMITPAMWLLDRYQTPFQVVYTNYPGEIVYEDEFQVAVKVSDDVPIVEYHHQWFDEDGNLIDA